MIRVLIVENDPMARALLEMFVRSSKAYTITASIRCEDLTPELIADSRAQLILLSTGALAQASWIKADFPETKLIVMTADPECGYIASAKEAGADSFWYQQPDEKALFEIMDAAMAGKCVYPEQMIVRLGEALSTDFTEREIQVLREVVSGSTDAEIADRLSISLRTVKGHIQNLREKTGYRNRTELAVHARSSRLIIQ